MTSGAMCLELAWKPDRFPPDGVMDGEEAAACLRTALEETHRALADAFPRPLITVSGGLDSAIVATGMARHAQVALLTLYADDARSDERHYADLVAQACDARLTYARYALPDFSTCCRQEMFLPRPSHRTVGALVNARLLDQAFLGGHDAILNGYGGDNVFWIMAPPIALRDHLHNRSEARAIRETVKDLRRLTGASYSQLLVHILRTAVAHWSGASAVGLARNDLFLSPEARCRRVPNAPHPWFSGTAAVSPGRNTHVAALVQAHLHLERFSRHSSVPSISPLLLAPVVEACLSIPSWLWCANGVDRSVARRAAPDLPSAIVNRTSKGSPVALHSAFFEQHRHELKGLLVEGMLAEQGLLDTDAVMMLCNQHPPTRNLDHLRLLELADAEIWCRYWSGV